LEIGFRRILVAVDGSPVSMRAVDHAVWLAKREAAELVALHVVPRPPFEASFDPAQYFEDARRAAKRWLKDVEAAGLRQGVRIRSEILVDASSPLEMILGYAESNRVDLIVAGTRGRTPSSRMLMGSVASGLVQYANCAVLVIR